MQIVNKTRCFTYKNYWILMAHYFYVNAQNEQKGPVSAEELARCGVNRSTLVWREGMPQWQPAGSLPELSFIFAPQPATPPPVNPAGGTAQGPRPQQGPVYQSTEIKPDNWLVWSILSTVLCCLPLGIVAIVYSSKVDGLWLAGHRDEARAAASQARLFCWISFGLGLAALIFYLIVLAAAL